MSIFVPRELTAVRLCYSKKFQNYAVWKMRQRLKVSREAIPYGSFGSREACNLILKETQSLGLGWIFDTEAFDRLVTGFGVWKAKHRMEASS